ncbi:MAG TPA: outer membrane beta-barrel protein [Nitrospira sp.]|mgnify:CR=1 FL=1|nr:outer membrane beta-barrel protein [Nitrospira sp.]
MKVRSFGRNTMMWSVLAGCLALSGPALSLAAEESAHDGGARPGEIVAGFRVGPSFSTTPFLSTAGPNLNFQGLYGLNKWIRVGMTLDWEQHKISDAGRGTFGVSGQFSTVTLLPAYLEYRPGHFGQVYPYVGTGIGVNINNKDVSNTFAWRAAGGIDYYIMKNLALNTEVKYTRNTTDGVDLGSVALLFGLRMSFGGQS